MAHLQYLFSYTPFPFCFINFTPQLKFTAATMILTHLRSRHLYSMFQYLIEISYSSGEIENTGTWFNNCLKLNCKHFISVGLFFGFLCLHFSSVCNICLSPCPFHKHRVNIALNIKCVVAWIQATFHTVSPMNENRTVIQSNLGKKS